MLPSEDASRPCAHEGLTAVPSWMETRGEASTQLSVMACLSEIEALVTTSMGARHSLKVHVLESLPVLDCDRDGFKTAILNLLSNAREAMPNGGTIELRAGSCSNGEGVEVSIVDSGVGMTEETIRLASERFFTTKAAGLGGLGLPMAEQFAREAGGRILIESLFGVGTIVRLQCPAPRRHAPRPGG